MEVINPRAALLSNFEVLTLLKELEAEQLTEARAVIAVKKEQLENGYVVPKHRPNMPPTPEVSENLRTVEFEAIKHLSESFQPMVSQTPQGIRKLTKGLAPYGLTKGEKLQIVNLAPTQPVELYVIVEELEDRLNEKMDEILSLVQESLGETGEGNADADAEGEWEQTAEESGVEVVGEIGDQDVEMHNDFWDADADADMFVDNEGGFEGDLDAEDDEE